MFSLFDATATAFRKQLKRTSDRHSWIRHTNWPAVILVLVALAFALWRLDAAPPLFWDEGWTLMVARTWVERGFYGRLLSGQPTAVGLSAAPPVVASVALSFRLLGIGVWQGRLVIVLYAMGALWLLYWLARRLYNRRIATASLAFVLFVIPLLPYLHPLHLGRMVMAEMPMLFFLLAGYACFLLALHKSVWFMPLAVLCWGIGLYTKAQPRPFWFASLATTLCVMLFRRQWKAAILSGMGLIGSLQARQWLAQLWQSTLPRGAQRGYAIPGLVSASAVVLIPHVRLAALRLALIVGAWAMLGMAYAIWQMAGEVIRERSSSHPTRLALLTFAGSWMAWFVLLSSGWQRYLTPALFVGSIFAAQTLYDWTGGFDWRATVKRAATTLRHRRFRGEGLRALLAVMLVAWTIPSSAYSLLLAGMPVADTSVYQAAEYLNTQTAPDALIESYSSELLFLLDRPYHFPPDELNVPVIEALTWQKVVPVGYDPLTADPDYLVVNWDFATWIVYAQAVKSDAFRSLARFGPYEIYERVR